MSKDAIRLNKAIVAAQQGRWAEALRICDKLSSVNHEVLRLKGMAQIQTGCFQKASASLRLLSQSPKCTAADFVNLGIALQYVGEQVEALSAFDRALVLDAGRLSAHFNRASALLALGRAAEASEAFSRIVAQNPNDCDALIGLANSFLNLSENEKALDAYEAVLRIHPGNIAARLGQSNALLALGRPSEALVQLEMVRAEDRGSSDFLVAHSNALRMLGRMEEGLIAIEQALSVSPRHAGLHANRSSLLLDLDRKSEAVEAAETAFSLDGSAIYRVCLANALAADAKYEPALDIFDELIGAEHQRGDIWSGRANLLHALGRHEEAFADIDKALTLVGPSPPLILSRAYSKLLIGKFDEGWDDYEARLDVPGMAKWSFGLSRKFIPSAARDLENVGSFSGRAVTLLMEQGVGDRIMFASMISDVQRASGSVELFEKRRLIKLFRRSFPSLRIRCIEDEEPETFDALTFIGSLGRIFRRSPLDFPGEPYLVADQEKVARWIARMPVGTRRIGISWRGGTTLTRVGARSLTLDDFLPVLSRPGIIPISLQHGDVEAELEAFRQRTGINILSFPNELDDLDDLASLVKATDAVVTVQNTNVHLSGALGVPCYALIPSRPEWRYGAYGDTMPWYKSVRLFRRSGADISDIMDTIAGAVMRGRDG